MWLRDDDLDEEDSISGLRGIVNATILAVIFWGVLYLLFV